MRWLTAFILIFLNFNSLPVAFADFTNFCIDKKDYRIYPSEAELSSLKALDDVEFRNQLSILKETFKCAAKHKMFQLYDHLLEKFAEMKDPSVVPVLLENSEVGPDCTPHDISQTMEDFGKLADPYLIESISSFDYSNPKKRDAPAFQFASERILPATRNKFKSIAFVAATSTYRTVNNNNLYTPEFCSALTAMSRLLPNLFHAVVKSAFSNDFTWKEGGPECFRRGIEEFVSNNPDESFDLLELFKNLWGENFRLYKVSGTRFTRLAELTWDKILLRDPFLTEAASKSFLEFVNESSDKFLLDNSKINTPFEVDLLCQRLCGEHKPTKLDDAVNRIDRSKLQGFNADERLTVVRLFCDANKNGICVDEADKLLKTSELSSSDREFILFLKTNAISKLSRLPN